MGAVAAAGPVVAAVAGVAMLGKVALEAAQAIWRLGTSTEALAENRMRASLSSLEGGAAGGILKALNKVSMAPGISRDEAVQGYIQSRNAGMGRELAMKMLQELGNANALGGGDKDKLSRALLAMNQMFMKGKVSQEEMLQLTEAGIPMGKVMQKAFGTTNTEDIQKMGLSAEEAVTRMVAAFSTLPRAVDSEANALETSQSNFSTALGVIGNGILVELGPSLRRFGDYVMGLINSGALDRLGTSLGHGLGRVLDVITKVDLEHAFTVIGKGIEYLAATAEWTIDRIMDLLKFVNPTGAIAYNLMKKKGGDSAPVMGRAGSSLGDLPPIGGTGGQGSLDPLINGAIKTISQLMESRANARRAGLGRGGASLSDIMTGGGDLGRLGVTAVELGGGGGGAKPAIVVQGGRELNEGVRMIVMSVIDQMQQGGQLAKA